MTTAIMMTITLILIYIQATLTISEPAYIWDTTFGVTIHGAIHTGVLDMVTGALEDTLGLAGIMDTVGMVSAWVMVMADSGMVMVAMAIIILIAMTIIV